MPKAAWSKSRLLFQLAATSLQRKAFTFIPTSATALPKKSLRSHSRRWNGWSTEHYCLSGAVITAAVQSTKSLYETIKRFKDRNKTLRRLQDELEDLSNILNSLTQGTNAETSMLALLQGPIERCSQVCRDFEQSMEVFIGKSKTGIRDWTKMEFMRGDINEFIDTIAGYKSTISVGLGTISMSVASLCLLQTLLISFHKAYLQSLPPCSSRIQRNDPRHSI